MSFFVFFCVFLSCFSSLPPLLSYATQAEQKEHIFHYIASKACIGRGEACAVFLKHIKKSFLEKVDNAVLNVKAIEELGLIETRGAAGIGIVDKFPCHTESGRAYTALKLA